MKLKIKAYSIVGYRREIKVIKPPCPPTPVKQTGDGNFGYFTGLRRTPNHHI